MTPARRQSEAEATTGARRRALLVIDGDSFAHRAFHALPRSIRRANGSPGNLLTGLVSMVLRLWQAERPRAVFVGWDTLTVPTYRHEPGEEVPRAPVRASDRAGQRVERPVRERVAVDHEQRPAGRPGRRFGLALPPCRCHASSVDVPRASCSSPSIASRSRSVASRAASSASSSARSVVSIAGP